MYELVPEHEAQFIVVVTPLGQENDHRLERETHGQRCRDGGGAHEPWLSPASEIRGRQFLEPDAAAQLHGIAQDAAAEAQMLRGLPEHDQAEASKPDVKERNCEVAPAVQYEQRDRGADRGIGREVQDVGQEPERGAGPGADMPPQPGHQGSEQEVVEHDGEENRVEKAQQQAPPEFFPPEDEYNDHKESQIQRQRAEVGEGGIAPPFAGLWLVKLVLEPEQGGDRDHNGDHKCNQEPCKHTVAHSSSLSNRPRSSSISSRLRPLSQRAAARTESLPPQSLSRKLRLCAAR